MLLPAEAAEEEARELILLIRLLMTSPATFISCCREEVTFVTDFSKESAFWVVKLCRTKPSYATKEIAIRSSFYLYIYLFNIAIFFPNVDKQN